jgi:hypothetical protein
MGATLAMLEIKFKCKHGFPVTANRTEPKDFVPLLKRETAPSQSDLMKRSSLVS